jgi:hypothetical protein
MAIASWSHSKLVDFEKCKFLAWLKHDQRIPEPLRPLPPGKTEFANDRGSRIHDNCEQYVRGDTDELLPEAEKHFGPQLDFMRMLYAEGMVSLEGEWGMSDQWEPVEWRKAWLRLKLDAIVHVDKTEAVVIDYKTGKKFGNEIKHNDQLLIYVVCTFLRYPYLERVTAELWYLDQDEVTSKVFTRDQGLRFRTALDRRGRAITECTDFPPNPNVYSCQYCQYGPWNGGQCTVGKRR